MKHDIQDTKLNVDYVYLMPNNYFTLNEATDHLDNPRLIVDAGTGERQINDNKNRALQLHINYKLLKRNKSLISVSN